MSGSKMEIDRERDDADLQLQSESVENAPSCSSSILNTPEKEGHGNDDNYYDDDDLEDGINVTLISSPPPPLPTKPLGNLPEQPDGSPKEAKEKKGKKLSGAGQKRFKRLLESGLSREEAFRLAQTPQQPPDQSKRSRNSDLNGSNSSGNPRPPKMPRQSHGNQQPLTKNSAQQRIDALRSENSGKPKGTEDKINPSYKEVVSGVKLGILPKGYPNSELTTEQLMATQKSIIAKVAGQRKEALKPKFGHCAFKSGYLVIVCKNQETADWLSNIIPTLKPWDGAELTVVDAKDIPRPEILIGFFPWSAEDNNEEILALLESQNDGLVVDAWRILQRNIINQQHVELIFTVDGVSMNSIKDSEFVLDFKFGNAPIRKKFHKQNLAETTESNDQNNEQSGRAEPRSDHDSDKTHDETGDDRMILDHSDKIPGSSGVMDVEQKLDSVHTTNTICEIKNDGQLTNKGSAPGYRNINLQANRNPSMGNRRTNVGEKARPSNRGKPSQQH